MNTELPIGVCGWCIDRHDVCKSIEVAGRELGIRFVQIGFFTDQAVQTADARAILKAARGADVTIVGAFVAFEGEDYASIARITETGGFMPGDAYAARLAITHAVADLASEIQCPSLSIHAGTIPTDPSSPVFARLCDRVREISDYLKKRSLRLLLETGREPVDALLRFIDAVDRHNIGINFDPGNFMIYGTDEPATAVTKLKGRIELVHVKDAFRSARPGVEYGHPSPIGTGHVQIARVVSKLRATGYRGPLLIECDTREGGLGVIRGAADYIRTMLE